MKTLEERAKELYYGLYRLDYETSINLISNFLKEQDKITRRACAENVGDEYIDCPECKNMEDEQYYCVTCNSQGGNGSTKASSIIMNTKTV